MKWQAIPQLDCTIIGWTIPRGERWEQEPPIHLSGGAAPTKMVVEMGDGAGGLAAIVTLDENGRHCVLPFSPVDA